MWAFLRSFGFSAKRETNLKRSGIYIAAVINDITINNSVTINGCNPKRLACESILLNGSRKYSKTVTSLTTSNRM